MPVEPTEKEVSKVATVSAILPSKSNFSISQLSQETESENAATTLDIEQRDLLFFDERLKVIVVLSLAECDEKSLQSLLARLDIILELWASSEGEHAIHPSSGAEAKRELIWSQRIKHDADPFVLLTQDDAQNVMLNLAWETVVNIQRPRTRLINTHISVMPNASIRSKEEASAGQMFLEPLITTQASIFQPMFQAPGFEDEAPYLSMSRLQLAPKVKSLDMEDYQIRNMPLNPIRVVQAIATRLKYTKTFGRKIHPSLTASLEIELLSIAEGNGKVEKVDMTLAAGKALNMTTNMLPIDCRSRDCVTLLFSLEAGESSKQIPGLSDKPYMDLLTVSIRTILYISEDCTPELFSSWTTNIDFSVTENPIHSGGNQGLQRSSRPPSLQLNTATQTTLQPKTFFQSLSISLSAPASKVKVGKPFIWKILVVNNSTKASRLAVVPMPRVARNTTQAQQNARRHASKVSNVSVSHRERSRRAKANDVAPAHVDENIIYAMQHSGIQLAETEIISLTPELVIGPLEPGQCHEDEIKLVAYKVGVFTFDAIRIVDLTLAHQEALGTTNNITDLRDLPDIITEE